MRYSLKGMSKDAYERRKKFIVIIEFDSYMKKELDLGVKIEARENNGNLLNSLFPLDKPIESY
ncbi:hypothetical protein KEJ50_05985 [Candidatus Bathyarchaeota archaeon]|nr:hypothetical protein [Candidatus Bathyarchaeota archaeon]